MRQLTRTGLLLLLVLFTATTVLAQAGFALNWFTVDGGGGGASGGTFTINGTIGQHDAGGTLTGGDYDLAGGFWGGGIFAAPPEILAVTPDNGPDSLDVTITISGQKFVSLPRVLLGELQLSAVSFINDTTITAVIPAGLAVGSYDLTVINPGGQADTLANAYTVNAAAAPRPLSVTPNRGRNDLTTLIEIGGEGFVPRSQVRLGAIALTVSGTPTDTRIVAEVPAGLAVGVYPLTVINPGARSGTLLNAYTVFYGPPQIISVVPSSGRNDSTTTLVINGRGFVPTPSVTLNGTSLRFIRFNDSNQIEATVPARLATGSYSMRLTNPDGQFADLAGAFTVTALPPPPAPDLIAEAWEVTQGVQNLRNQVPLVAGKPTYVRVYGRQANGSPSPFVEAVLHGTRGGVPLPGSPLRTLNGTIRLTTGGTFNRANLNDGWLFQLPASWANAGVTDLRVEVDPRSRYDTINRGNNQLVGAFSFRNTPPLCLVFVRLRMHGPTATTADAHFWETVNLAERLFPVSSVLVYDFPRQIEESGFLGFSAGAFEMPEDGSKIIDQLTDLSIRGDDPRCNQLGSRTHLVGMVHSDVNTGSVGGQGRMPGRGSWVKMANPTETAQPNDWNWPYAGVITAHEVGHNYGRRHAGCSVAADNYRDADYPYRSPDECRIDEVDNTLATFYGFDGNSRTPIHPFMSNTNGAADFMSYGARVWTSDYTWRALLNTRGSTASPVSPVAPVDVPLTLDATTNLVYASGWIVPAQRTGSLDYAWVLPPSGSPDPDNGEPTGFALRLIGNDGAVLHQQSILFADDDPHNLRDPNQPRGFSLVFPAPDAAVARLDLVDGERVIATLLPGATPPGVQLDRPAAGELVDNTLEVEWQANDSDGDRLLYLVEYSPDNGQSWQLLAMNYDGGTGNVRFVLDDISALVASDTALVRVAATDGYNTTLVTSQPFRVADSGPRPFIISPTAGQPFAAGAMIDLRGGATDAADGRLEDTALRWQVDGADVGNGSQLSIEGLNTGVHTATLLARNSANNEASTRRSFLVKPLDIPAGNAPDGNTFCDDPAYAAGTALRLAPYGDNGQATAVVLRTAEELWICFDGLATSSDTTLDRVGLYFDSDAARSSRVQTDDKAIFVDEQGFVSLLAGDGQGGYSEQPAGTIRARVGGSDAFWVAELRVPFAALGQLQAQIGLALSHELISDQPAQYQWPFSAAGSNPASWAEALLGIAPQITAISPDMATIGLGPLVTPAASAFLCSVSNTSSIRAGEAFTLTISGSNFVAGSQVYWEGSPRATTFVSDELLQAEMLATDTATAGLFTITVVNPDLPNTPSNGAIFTVHNPQPTIDQATLETTPTSEGYPLVVSGSNFVAGATIYVDGVPLTTSLINGNEVRASLALTGLSGRIVEVVVINPGPGGGSSNGVELRIPEDILPITDDLTAASADLWLLPASAKVNQPGTIGLILRRTGGAEDLSNVAVRFYLNGVEPANLLAESSVALLAANASASTLPLNWTPTIAGQVTLYAVIDPANGVPELNESNNIISRTLVVRAEREERVITGLVALYTFEEGTGEVVNDVSGVGMPLNLRVRKPSAVSWVAGGLSVDAFTSIASSGAASKVIAAAKASNEITLEAWVTPAELEQFSARLVTISANPTRRNLSLIQGLFTSQESTLVSARLRTSSTAADGGAALLTSNGILPPRLTQVVFVREAGGTVRIYIDGVERATGTLAGSFANWNDNYPLALAGEVVGGRSWRGVYHLVAIYGRALTGEEVLQNYAAGP
jgi:hypothetical protein